MRQCLVGLLLLLVPLASLQSRDISRRVIRICVVDDAENPVPTQVMGRALEIAEQTYRDRFDVRIRWTYEGRSYLDPDKERLLQDLKRRCSSNEDFGAVFTASEGPLDSLPLHKMGSAYPAEGYFRIYTGPVCVHRLQLQEKINAAFEHEFAHMWGAPHENQPGSLMYPTLSQSPKWSAGLEEYIHSNLDRRWWRIPEYEIPKAKRQ